MLPLVYPLWFVLISGEVIIFTKSSRGFLPGQIFCFSDNQQASYHTGQVVLMTPVSLNINHSVSHKWRFRNSCFFSVNLLHVPTKYSGWGRHVYCTTTTTTTLLLWREPKYVNNCLGDCWWFGILLSISVFSI